VEKQVPQLRCAARNSGRDDTLLGRTMSALVQQFVYFEAGVRCGC
jgi:hypothetical protein